MTSLKLARRQLAITTLYDPIFVAVTIGIAGPERQNPTPSLGGKAGASTDTPHAPAVDELQASGPPGASRLHWSVLR
jgi:hypothetical protein